MDSMNKLPALKPRFLKQKQDDRDCGGKLLQKSLKDTPKFGCEITPTGKQLLLESCELS